MDGQTDRQTDGQTDTNKHTGQRDRQTDSDTHTDKHTDRHIHRQTNRWTDRQTKTQTNRWTDRHGQTETNKQTGGGVCVSVFSVHAKSCINHHNSTQITSRSLPNPLHIPTLLHYVSQINKALFIYCIDHKPGREYSSSINSIN